MWSHDPESRDAARRRSIENAILRPQSFLRRGSVPKWCYSNPRVRSPSPVFDPRLEEEVRRRRSSGRASSRAPILREDSSHRTKSLNDIHRHPSPSQDRTENRWTANPAIASTGRSGQSISDTLCEVCRGITFEAMSGEDGYDHLLLQEINESKLTCRMCSFLDGQFRGKVGGYSQERYRIRLTLDIRGDQWSSDHYKPSRSERDFTSAMVHVMDLRPWEPPEHYKVRYMYDESDNPEEFLQPQGSSPLSVRARSVSCFTEEHDLARQIGIRWIRNIGANTASTRSVEIAKGWLDKCLASGETISGWRVLPLRHGVTLATQRSQIGFGWSTSSEEDASSESNTPSESGVSSESNVSYKSGESADPDESPEPGTRRQPLRQSFPQDYPARIVRVRETSSKEIKLHLIDAQDSHYQYAALSYCWGVQRPEAGQKWQLTNKNEHTHYKNIEFDDLPQTIRESITFTLKLGVSYMWIDALCIIQDSSSDWAQEAAKMASIYRGSFVTIAVSTSASAEQGCFNSISQRTTELSEFKDLITVKASLRNGEESYLYFLDQSGEVPNMYEDEILRGPLSKRAWIYQEHVLPRRVIYFTSKQLFWECTHCRLSEDNFPQLQAARPYPILDFDYILDSDKIAAFWYLGAVQQYSPRQMTFEKDKLVAISALAKATYYNKESDYVAGLWKDSLTLGLTWCRNSPGHKSKIFPCPSWSWASQNSEVQYYIVAEALGDAMDRRLMYGGKEQECITYPASRIIRVDWKSDKENPFGNITDAYIDMETAMGTGIVILQSFLETTYYEKKHAQAILIPYTSKSGEAEWFEAVATMDDSGVTGARVAIALLREPTTREPAFLLLDPPDLNAKTFRRVGLAEQGRHFHRRLETDFWVQVTKSWERKTIRLI